MISPQKTLKKFGNVEWNNFILKIKLYKFKMDPLIQYIELLTVESQQDSNNLIFLLPLGIVLIRYYLKNKLF
jgi:hypothetical protein